MTTNGTARPRALHAAPPAPGTAPVPERDRAADPGRQDDPRDPRQLRCPQAPERPQMAGPPPPLGVPLHADLVLLAERDRGLLRQAHPAAPQTRCVPFARRSPGGDQSL